MELTITMGIVYFFIEHEKEYADPEDKMKIEIAINFWVERACELTGVKLTREMICCAIEPFVDDPALIQAVKNTIDNLTEEMKKKYGHA